MAAKGTESKNYIFSKLLEVFSDSFWEEEGKILRIPLEENGARVEVKVTLTAAKTNLGGDSVPSAFDSSPTPPPKPVSTIEEKMSTVDNNSLEPTEEEKENVSKLIAALGL